MTQIVPIQKTNELGLIRDEWLEPKQISVLYQRVQAVLDQQQIQFSVFCSRQLGATNLVESVDLRRFPGVNCYAFAVGRSPEAKIAPRDPVPGGAIVSEIRKNLVHFIFHDLSDTSGIRFFHFFNTSQFRKRSYTNQLEQIISFLEQLQEGFVKKSGEPLPCFRDILARFSEGNDRLRIFVRSYFGEELEDVLSSEPHLDEMRHLLLEEHKVIPERMIPPIVDSLLKLDGLIRVYPLDSSPSYEKEILKAPDFESMGFGSALIAAFCKENDDYHFVRLFDDGWYERHGDIIQKRPGAPEGIPTGSCEDIQIAFYPGREKDFVGYFVVPNTVTVVDGIGRKFIFESHKV